MSSSRERLHFNLAHCDDVVLFGFCKECELGVDIEQIRPLPEAEEIARRYFSANEFRCWQSLPASEKLAAFYHCWTRKEAVLKARGWGIGTGLDAFEVSLSPDKAAVVHMESSMGKASEWALRPLRPRPNCIGALACRTTALPVHCWAWPDNAAAASVSP
jgi:4'-phosphopantetheinyl transferase